ncbi:hypothetical protein [Providencia huaxiensis]|uniref:hypothetical protein n=1 Tax=Providencia huaxiensis TaxID=2027290 RepID=UPI00280CD0FF|nr:hypothetical protein [Providencia rettgeri]ELR5085887.1 hypothetical protein [Providencia rettgeri]
MHTHIFANLMLTSYEITVLSKEKMEFSNKKENNNADKKNKMLNLANQREIENFSLHQDFFAKIGNLKTKEYGNDRINPEEVYHKLINIIDDKEVFTRRERQMFFYRYEQLYNALVAQYVVTNLEKQEILKKYTKAIIPAIVALDMYKTLNLLVDKEQLHFYSHIHHFILSDYYSSDHHNLKSLCKGVRAYLKYYIKTLKFDPTVNRYEIQTSINNIRATSFSTICNIDTIIDTCKKEARDIGKPHDTEFEQLRVAYTSLSVLLAFQKKTHLLVPVVSHYKKLLDDKIADTDPLFFLIHYIYQDDKCHTTPLDEKALYNYIDELTSHEKIDISTCEDDCDCGQGLECDCQCIPKYVYTMLDILKEFIFENQPNPHLPTLEFPLDLRCLNPKNISLHELSSAMTDYFNDIPSIRLYRKIPLILQLLYDNELHDVREIINEISSEESPFGFFTSTIAIINLALKIKFEPHSIRYGSLLSYINPILTNQGIYTEYQVVMPNLKNPSIYVANMSKSPIINDPNNKTVIRSIMIYNRIIKKINIDNENILNTPPPQSVYGILDNIENSIKKIKNTIYHEKKSLTDKELANIIIQNKILTKHEINDNLIGILNEGTLYNCLGCLSYLYQNLKCSGEELPNILSFIQISDAEQEEIEKLRRALLIAKEKQTNKNS